jgi:flagellar basal body-associated protein FliL
MLIVLLVLAIVVVATAAFLLWRSTPKHTERINSEKADEDDDTMPLIDVMPGGPPS